MSHAEFPSQAEIAGLPDDGGERFNRLVFETSPYLLQHCTNPVDWYPWGEEAFELARSTDRPVFLSVGYSTCHWCHVMERESFERDEVADVLNALFVPVKVDREERPDLDEIYMAATQMLTGRGGWPMSVWLTPEREPFFAGTYFPREDRVVGVHPVNGPMVQPGFISLLERLSVFWKEHRGEALARARDLTDAVRQHCQQAAPSTEADCSGLVNVAIEALEAAFDPHHGGFGGAPKFPPHGALRLLLHRLERGDERGRSLVGRTLHTMAAGGIHDHVGGGFHRYSTDERWFLPHFEKMLYDNAQLGRSYVDGWRLLGDERHRLVAERLYDWVLREMVDEAGGFTSALDADSEGEEGTFYVWEPGEIVELLGSEIGAVVCETYDVTDTGNWRDESTGEAMSTSIPHLHTPLDLERWRAQISALETMYQRRVERVWPHHDDKVLTSWNGLMIGSLAHAGEHLGRPDFIDAAVRAATFARTTLWRDGRLLATYRAGSARLAAYLDDHVFLADGLLDLHAATGDDGWFDFARELVEVVLDRFSHPDGGYYFTSRDHEALLVRSRSGIDRAIPSGNGVAARVLHRLALATDETRYSEAASATVRAFASLMSRYTRATESLVLAADLLSDGDHGDAAQEGDRRVARAEGLSASWSSEALVASRGDSLPITLTISMDPEVHVQAARPTHEHLIATSLRLSGAEGLSLQEVVYPQPHEVVVGDMTLAVLSGDFELSAAVCVAQDAPLGRVETALVLRYQACDAQSCQRPTSLRLPLVVDVRAEAD